jgi:hypothetical protein
VVLVAGLGFASSSRHLRCHVEAHRNPPSLSVWFRSEAVGSSYSNLNSISWHRDFLRLVPAVLF